MLFRESWGWLCKSAVLNEPEKRLLSTTVLWMERGVQWTSVVQQSTGKKSQQQQQQQQQPSFNFQCNRNLVWTYKLDFITLEQDLLANFCLYVRLLWDIIYAQNCLKVSISFICTNNMLYVFNIWWITFCIIVRVNEISLLEGQD
jgi:hypothetical protein